MISGAGPNHRRCFHALWASLVAVWVFCWLGNALGAETPTRCELCKDYFTGTIYVVTDPIRQVKKHICLKCSKSTTVCSICRLAVNLKTSRKLDDGRLLCELDSKGAVLNEEEALAIFQEVKRDVQEIFKRFGPFPDENITAHLVDQNDFIKEYFRKPSVDDPKKLIGLTRTFSEGGSNHVHHIYLLSGVSRAQFMSVCAHEYTHTWLNERFTPTRTMNKDTVEGFCELIAWKYITSKGYTAETTRILENEYTQGQVRAMIAAEERYQFRRVIDWIEHGVDSWIDKDRLERVLQLKENSSDETSSVPPWQQITVRTTVPDTLTLRGISTIGTRRFALVNDRTLDKGEAAKVRVGTSNVVVRCIEIRDASVLLEIGDDKKSLQLFLSPAATKK